MNIAGIYEESSANGTGWRTVIFVSGCPHKCPGCHNPQTWDANYGEPYDEEKILNTIKKSDIIQGITLSGGEPFLYAKDLLPFVKKVKEMGLDIWAYTGYNYEELISMNNQDINNLLNEINVLVDGKYIKELRDTSLKFRGSSNQRIIDLDKIRQGFSIEQSLLE